MRESAELGELRKGFEEVLDDELPEGELATKDDLLTRKDVEAIAEETLDEFDEFDEEANEEGRDVRYSDEDLREMLPSDVYEVLREYLVAEGSSDSVGKAFEEEVESAIDKVLAGDLTPRSNATSPDGVGLDVLSKSFYPSDVVTEEDRLDPEIARRFAENWEPDDLDVSPEEIPALSYWDSR